MRQAESAVTRVGHAQQMLRARGGPSDQVGPLECHPGGGQRSGDPSLAVRPVRHLHVVAGEQEAQRDERPVGAVLAWLLFGQQDVDGVFGKVGRAGHAVPLSPESAEQDRGSAQCRVVAACIRARLRRPEPGRRPPVGRGELLEPCDGQLDTRSVEGGEDTDGAGEPVEVVVPRLVGMRRTSVSPIPSHNASSAAPRGRVSRISSNACANPPTPECMPYSPGSVWPGCSVSHIPSSPWRTWVNTHAQARSASSRYVDGSDDISRSWHRWHRLRDGARGQAATAAAVSSASA